MVLPLPSFIPDPAVTEDDAYAVRIRKQFERDPEFAERWLATHARTMAEYHATAAERQARWENMPRVPRDPLDGDYEMIGTIQSSDWGL